MINDFYYSLNVLLLQKVMRMYIFPKYFFITLIWIMKDDLLVIETFET